MMAQPENVRISLKMTAGLAVEAPFREPPKMGSREMPFRKSDKALRNSPAHARGTKIEVLFEKQAAPAL
jgi:hypothetical protein